MSLKILKDSQKKVYCVELDRTFKNIKDVAEAFESSYESVYGCIRKSGKYNGRHFKFLD